MQKVKITEPNGNERELRSINMLESEYGLREGSISDLRKYHKKNKVKIKPVYLIEFLEEK